VRSVQYLTEYLGCAASDCLLPQPGGFDAGLVYPLPGLALMRGRTPRNQVKPKTK
jgi:hypothetical protein